jgi:UPF0176 protein
MGKVALYYKYVFIENPKQIMKWQRRLCQRLELTGRILIANQGINGTVAGSESAIDGYINAMNKHELFGGIDFKIDEGGNELFPKLRTVVRDEIVTFGTAGKEARIENTGTHLSPEQTHDLISTNKNLVILDARNTYESKVGAFTNAIIPPIENFRDLPQFIDANEELFKGKDVLMYCTGGVRCELATAYLNQKNIASNVYQINGGIVRYTEKFPEGHFRGKNYVFDGRVAVRINNDVIGHCEVCGASNDDLTNCINVKCNKQYIACPTCLTSLGNTCSSVCHELVTTQAVSVRTQPKKVTLTHEQTHPQQCQFI